MARSTNTSATRSWRSGTRRSTISYKRSTPARPRWKRLLARTSAISSSSMRRITKRRGIQAAARRDRVEYRTLSGRKNGVRFPLLLFGAGRHRQRRFAAGGTHEGLPHPHRDRAGTEQNDREKFATLEIDRIQVKGKTEPETVFTLLGRADLVQNPNFRELRDLTAKMLGYYREQDWTQALATIELCRKASEPFGIGALFDMYAERIEAFRRHPPPLDWNGVYEAESK